jgi:hypothetical protein
MIVTEQRACPLSIRVLPAKAVRRRHPVNPMRGKSGLVCLSGRTWCSAARTSPKKTYVIREGQGTMTFANYSAGEKGD